MTTAKEASKRPTRRARRVRIVAPSSPFSPERLAAGVDVLNEHGFVVDDIREILRSGHDYLNGDDAHRAQTLEAALGSGADLLWVARGGYGLTRILDRLSLDGATRPPLMIGFSDDTALHAWLYARGIASIHGPLATTLADEPPESLAHLFALIDGHGRRLCDACTLLTGPPARVEGPALGGNLCVLTALCGTPHFPALDGAVLFLEEVGERPYRIDRMLTQLLSAGQLQRVAGVVVGQLKGCDPAAQAGLPHEVTGPLDVFGERLASLGVPVVAGAPFGHGTPNLAFVHGGRVALDARAAAEVTVDLIDGAPAPGEPRP